MAVTSYQAEILRLLSKERKKRGESYVAGGVALNALLSAPRKSRDIDLFHDTEEALAETWFTDRHLLEEKGYDIKVLREAPSFVEALVSCGSNRTAMQWARDSAFRFFPLIEDDFIGLSLHPFDLATNKILAMAGRLEVRDWVDVLNCDRQLQPFGYLVWAACGKDPGYNPNSLLSSAQRLHYSGIEIKTLEFEGNAPDASVLGAQWHGALNAASQIFGLLPPERAGTCVLYKNLKLYAGKQEALIDDLAEGSVIFHEGSIGGSWPAIKTIAPDS